MADKSIFATVVTEKHALETCLALGGFCALLSYRHPEQPAFALAAIAFAFVGLFVKSLALLIAKIWFKLPAVLGPIMTNIFLGAAFFLFLLPIAKLHRWSKKDSLQIKRDPNSKTLWVERNHVYDKKDLENVW